MKQFIIICLSTALISADYVWAETQMIYWTDSGTSKIQRANLDGSNVTTLVDGIGRPYGIAIDPVTGKMYWSDMDNAVIKRANLDGSQIENVVSTSLIHPRSIALDTGNNRMYWSDIGSSKIQYANLDGTGVTDLITGANTALSIALDLVSNKIYWTEEYTRKIRQADLNGTAVNDIFTDTGWLCSIDLDTTAGKMYWINESTSKYKNIRRANLNGSAAEYLISSGLRAPRDLALDVEAGKMYFSDVGLDKIICCNLDGTEAIPIVSFAPVSDVGTLTLGPIPEPATLSLLAFGGLALLRKRK